MANTVLAYNTPVANKLIQEKDLTKSVWCLEHLEEALTEIKSLANHDRDVAVLKVSCLYGMARLEFSSHFDKKFDPSVKYAPKPFFGKPLQVYCKKIFETLKHMGLSH